MQKKACKFIDRLTPPLQSRSEQLYCYEVLYLTKLIVAQILHEKAFVSMPLL